LNCFFHATTNEVSLQQFQRVRRKQAPVHPSAAIRIAAIDTLISFNGLSENEKDRAKYALWDLLNVDNSCAVRQHAGMALGSVGGIDVVEALRKALADGCVEVRTAADKTIRSILAKQKASKNPPVPVAHTFKR
jgi:HEAT repeat protein